MGKMKNFLRGELEKLKPLSPKERVGYIWDYYKIPILVTLIVVALGTSAIVHFATRKNPGLYVVLVNAQDREDSLFEDLLEKETGQNIYVEVDDTYQITHDGSDFYMIQVIAALFSMGDVDLFAADEETFSGYASQQCFADLTTVLPPEILDACGENLWYGEENGAKVLCGIRLKEDSPLHKAGWYRDEVIIGLSVSAKNPDRGALVLKGIVDGI